MVGRNYQINHLQVFKQLNPRKKKKKQHKTSWVKKKKKKKRFQVNYMTILRRCLRLSYFSY